jgi:probable rRNA maturation factor
LLAHGTLHLFGYDHKENTEAEAMEELEIKYLKDFNIRNPYTYEI